MFRAEQLTDGGRQRRRAPRSHAVTIRQAAATTDKTAETGGNVPPLSKMQEKLQEKSFPCVLHTIIPTETGRASAASCKIGAKMQEAQAMSGRLRGVLTTEGTKGGRVYNSEGARLSPAPRNSSPRLHVPFFGSISMSHTRIRSRSYAERG